MFVGVSDRMLYWYLHRECMSVFRECAKYDVFIQRTMEDKVPFFVISRLVNFGDLRICRLSLF